MISRGTGRSAVAAAAYMSCSRITNDYDGVTHDYTRKQGLVYDKVYLPANAPENWVDRAVLWNEVEKAEKTKDRRLAREFIIALPVEFDLHNQIWQVENFVKKLTEDGMCADVCIHDTDGHNPHAHIMVTVRPLNRNGTWQAKTQKEYLCIRNGEERGFTSAECKTAERDGWEKQYLYKVGKAKRYLPPSQADGLERVNKYPKSSRYGRQNPISERWNSEEQLNEWRRLWADIVNQDFEICDSRNRIDHRSFAARGIKAQPTIHEGVSTRAIKAKKTHKAVAFELDRIVINRLIREDNQLLNDLRDAIKYLMKTIRLMIPKIADTLETLRVDMMVFEYKRDTAKGHRQTLATEADWQGKYVERYKEIDGQIKDKEAEVKALKHKFKLTLALFKAKRAEITVRLSELNGDLNELRSEKSRILQTFQSDEKTGIAQTEAHISDCKANISKFEVQEQEFSTELQNTLTVYNQTMQDAAELDQAALSADRLKLRPAKEQNARKQARSFDDQPSEYRFNRAVDTVSELIGEKPPHYKTDYEIKVEQMEEAYRHEQEERLKAYQQAMQSKYERKPSGKQRDDGAR